MIINNVIKYNLLADTIASLFQKKGNSLVLAKGFILLVMKTLLWVSPAYAGAEHRSFDYKELSVLGLTEDGYLVRFKSTSPRRMKTIGYVEGFDPADTRLVGIDFRVQNSLL